MPASRVLALLLLVLCVGGVFLTGIDGPFVFDDFSSIPFNPHIRELGLEALTTMPEGETVDGRPVVQFSLAINHALGGLDVRGYHVGNILLHVGSCLLLFDLVRRVLSGPRYAAHLGSAATGLATATALLWGLHPLQTEAVTYVIQRTELLKGFFLLATLDLALIGFAAEVRPGGERIARWCLVGSVVACLLGMGSKESMVGAPLLVLLADRAFASGSFREAWRRHRAFYLGLLLTTVVVLWAVLRGSRSTSVGFDHGVGPWENLLTQSGVLVWYLRLSLWPEPLSITYDWPVARSFVDAWFTFSLMAVLFVVTVVCLVRRPGLGLLGAWFFVILGPTSSIVPIATEMVGERRMYLPLAAVVVLAVVIGWQVLVALASWRRDGREEASLRAHGADREDVRETVLARNGASPRPAWPAVVGGLLVAGLAGVAATGTVSRIAVFSDELALWTDTLTKHPRSWYALTNTAKVLRDRGRADESLVLLDRATELYPDEPDVHIDTGNSYMELQDFESAVAAYDRAIRLDPRIAPAHHNRGLAFARSERFPEAIAAMRRAVELDPGYAAAHANLAVLLVRTGGDSDAAAYHLTEALRLEPGNEAALSLLSRLGPGA